MRLIERWDSRYRGDTRPGWDKGFASSHLKAAVEGGEIKPGRAVVLGCGTGTNAIFLAKKGFDVTAVDIAPTALNLAEEKAKKADVKVRWLLADVLAPPANLEKFDFIFDRGCYHGVRRSSAEAYVKTVKQLSRPGTQILILAGNANEQRQSGPPRVKEEELRGDFSAAFEFVRLDTVRFDSANPNQKGALAWSVLLRRKAAEGP
jgi:SAM-dependent methyltransferase